MSQLSLIKKEKYKKRGPKVSTGHGSHRAREALSGKHPLHVTLRLKDGLSSLRSKKGSKLVKHAILGVREYGLRVVHFSILSNHVHLFVECENVEVLKAGMKSFSCRLSIGIRKSMKRGIHVREGDGKKGLFKGRYHVHVLTSPRKVKRALRYVLLNPAKHFGRRPYIDKFTSAAVFKSWKELLGYELKVPCFVTMKERLSFLCAPELWLSIHGWQRG